MSNDCDSLHYYYTVKKGCSSMRSTSDPLHVSTAERSELKTARAQCWIARAAARLQAEGRPAQQMTSKASLFKTVYHLLFRNGRRYQCPPLWPCLQLYNNLDPHGRKLHYHQLSSRLRLPIPKTDLAKCRPWIAAARWNPARLRRQATGP